MPTVVPILPSADFGATPDGLLEFALIDPHGNLLRIGGVLGEAG
jgi:hypothetical protein